MDFYIETVRWIEDNMITGLFISVLFLIISKALFKEKVDTVKALYMIKLILIPYSISAIIYTVLLFLFPSDEYSVISRATGPYWWAYWLMIFCHCLLPLTLLWNKLSYKIYYVLAVTILMNLGWLLESFIMHMISIHRDYMPDNADINMFLPFPRERIILLKGFVIGIVILLTANGRQWFIRSSRSIS